MAQPPNPETQEGDDRSDYYAGAALSVLCGLGGSLMYVLPARCQACPRSLLMVSSGAFSLLIAFLCPAMGVTNRIFSGMVQGAPSGCGLHIGVEC